jgi:hypothetical protein
MRSDEEEMKLLAAVEAGDGEPPEADDRDHLPSLTSGGTSNPFLVDIKTAAGKSCVAQRPQQPSPRLDPITLLPLSLLPRLYVQG